MVAWLWSPVIFNPNGVEWLDVIKDFDGWLQWMMAEDDDPDKSWHAWWIQQNAVRGRTLLFSSCYYLSIAPFSTALPTWDKTLGVRLGHVEKCKWFY